MVRMLLRECNLILIDKVFLVTLDSAYSSITAMKKLTPEIKVYTGDLFLHQWCACHIINLILVMSSLKRLKPYIKAFRIAIPFVSSSNQLIAAYESYCIVVGVRSLESLDWIWI